MTDVQDDHSNSKVPVTAKDEADGYDAEINLADYMTILWKRRFLVLAGSLVPVLLVGLALQFSPRRYKVTYIYDKGTDASDGGITQQNYRAFVDQFYSKENTDRITVKLPDYDLLKVSFETWPPFISLSELKIDTLDQLDIFSQTKAQLLYVSIVGRDKNNILKSASVIRENLEYVLPLYSVLQEKKNAAIEFRKEMAIIEQGKFLHELDLKTNMAILDRSRKVETARADKAAEYPVWQIDVSSNAEYLPLEYQIQAAQLGIAKLEEEIEATSQRCNYYRDLIALNDRLSKELKDGILANHDYTIRHFRSFLVDLLGDSQGSVSEDYLSSYIKTIDNRISASAPVVEKAKVYTVSKGVSRKLLIVFVAALILSVLVAFLAEGIQQEKALSS